jgi:hypothetical protein
MNGSSMNGSSMNGSSMNGSSMNGNGSDLVQAIEKFEQLLNDCKFPNDQYEAVIDAFIQYLLAPQVKKAKAREHLLKEIGS